jgi:hypothetical protein
MVTWLPFSLPAPCIASTSFCLVKNPWSPRPQCKIRRRVSHEADFTHYFPWTTPKYTSRAGTVMVPTRSYLTAVHSVQREGSTLQNEVGRVSFEDQAVTAQRIGEVQAGEFGF